MWMGCMVWNSFQWPLSHQLHRETHNWPDHYSERKEGKTGLLSVIGSRYVNSGALPLLANQVPQGCWPQVTHEASSSVSLSVGASLVTSGMKTHFSEEGTYLSGLSQTD